MTLVELIKNTYKLIEEYSSEQALYTETTDFSTKIRDVINQVQFEIARNYKKIPAYFEKTNIEEGDTLDLKTLDNFYQLDIIEGLDYSVRNNLVKFNESGTANIYYFRFPTIINDLTAESFELELMDDAIMCMPYGVAADLLLMDNSNAYGAYLKNRYQELLKMLDPRFEVGGNYNIVGGLDI